MIHHAQKDESESADLSDIEQKLRKTLTRYGTLRGKIRPEVASLMVVQGFRDASAGFGGMGAGHPRQPEYAFGLLAPDPASGVRVTQEDKELVDEAMRQLFPGYIGPDPRAITGMVPEHCSFGPEGKPLLAIYPVVAQGTRYIQEQIDAYPDNLKREYDRLTEPDKNALLTNVLRAISGDQGINVTYQDFEREEAGDYINYKRISVFGIGREAREQLLRDLAQRIRDSGFDAEVQQSDIGPNVLLREAPELVEVLRAAYPAVTSEAESSARRHKAERFQIRLPEGRGV